MTENTKIEWADHTFNPWIGCTKVSPACDHCYAERVAQRMQVQWGPGQIRKRTRPANWNQPLRWNRQAAKEGVRYRVFCASLADVFDNEVPQEWREDLWPLIEATPNLDWLLLTKRIGNVLPMIPMYWRGDLPPNVWIGATIVNQAEANRDIPKLLEIPAAVRFLSCEPLLGPVDLNRVWASMPGGGKSLWDALSPRVDREAAGLADDPLAATLLGEGVASGHASAPLMPRVDWVIAGGESGPNARPMHPDWVRSLRDQCQAAGVPFFFKQWGEWLPSTHAPKHVHVSEEPGVLSRDGTWRRPQAIADPPEHVFMLRVGKKAAGRQLDGRTWDQTPEDDHG